MLKLKSLITPSAMLAAFTLAAAPSFAQERYHGRENRSGQESSGQGTERAQPRSETPRGQPPPPAAGGGGKPPRPPPRPGQPPPGTPAGGGAPGGKTPRNQHPEVRRRAVQQPPV